MDQSQEFVESGNENKVRKLTRSLYGLEQAPKNGIKIWSISFLPLISESTNVTNVFIINL